VELIDPKKIIAMNKIFYVAEFPLKYGDVCVRVYKSLAIAKREVSKARTRFQAPIRFHATIYSHEHCSGKVGVIKKLILEIED
jgi:hypothetical protein